MPKSPVREFAVGMLSAEEFNSGTRGAHFEIRADGSSHLVIFPHELDDLENLVKQLKAARNRPVLVLDERRHA